MAAADPAAALALYLKTVPAVDDLVDGRVFRPNLDDPDEIKQMPRGAIVVRRAGGYGMFGGANIPVGDPRLDIFCYGDTFQASETLASEVVIALKALRQHVVSGVRLYWARIEGGPLPIPDPEDHWPQHVVTAQLAFCELAVA